MEKAVKDIEAMQGMAVENLKEMTCNTELRQYAMYLLSGGRVDLYPATWTSSKANIRHLSYEQQLLEAGAYIAAEIDRIREIDYSYQLYERHDQQSEQEDAQEHPKAFREH